MRSYRSGYNRYAGRWPYRSWRRPSLLRSQQSGRRLFSCVIPANEAFELTVPSQQQWTELVAVSPYFYNSELAACKCAIVSSPLYRVYTQLYDQVKINGVSLKISVMTNIGSGGVVDAIKVVTQWDRDAQYKEVAEGHDLPTTHSIEVGSESQSKLIVNNSRAILYRSNWASDLQEKTTFHDCSIDASGSTIRDRVYYAGGNVGYTPSLFMAIMASSMPGLGATYKFNVAVEANWHVTFRNPKYGLTVSGSRSADLSALASVGVKSDVKGGVEVSEGSVLSKKVKIEDSGDDDDVDGMRDESSQPQFTKEELLEMLKKYEEKKD